jgi:peptidoglycan/LPS O-acetylase OafA/YrhL
MGLKYIKGFDGLRAISVLMVILSHLGIYDAILDRHQVFKTRVYDLFSGSTGVHIFFVISGFLITTLLIIEKNKTGNISLKKFFIKRVLRLYPVFIVFLMMVAVLMHFKFIAGSKVGLIFAFVYIYNFISIANSTPELGHIWSLSLEEQFYLIWPFMVLSFNRYNLLLVCLFSTSISLLLITIMSSFLGEVMEKYYLYRWFFPSSLPIFIGSIFSIVYNYKMFNIERVLNSKVLPLFIAGFYLSSLFIPTILLKYYIMLQSISIVLALLWIVENQGSVFVKMLDIKI